MDNTLPDLSYLDSLCEEKAAKVMRWIAESEDIAKSSFTVSKLFEHGVLPENTSSFLRLLLEEQYSNKDKDNEFELSPEELHILLIDAFKITARYLLTPRSFIPEFLSFQSNSVHINVKVLARLKSFTDYEYFPEMIEEWFAAIAQRSSSEQRKNELLTFIHDAENSILKYSSPDEIAKYLMPLFEFIGDESSRRNLLEIFIGDKGLPLLQSDLQNVLLPESLSLYLHEQFKNWEIQQSAIEAEAIPEYSTFLKELREVGVMLPEPHPPKQHENTNALPPLEMFINKKLRRKCLEKIFHNNEQEYDRAITLFDTIDDFEQAELNLYTLLKIHKVREESKVALRLFEALRLRFGISTSSE